MSDEEETEDQEEMRGAREMWAQHEYTLSQAKSARKEATGALQMLVQSCETSTDPNIARLHGKYVGWKLAMYVFDTAQKKKTTVGFP